MLEQPLRQDTGQRRDIELHQVGQVGVEHALQCLAHHRMVAAEREYAKAAEQVEIARAITVVEVLTGALLEADVVADGFEDADELLVEMPGVHRTALRFARREHLGEI